MKASRSFAAGITAIVLTLMSAQPASAQAPTKLRFQAAFPASSLIFENFKFWAERVKALSGGRLQIEMLPPGAVVPAFEVLDAVHKGVIDGGHTAAAYWVGKNRAATLFGPRPVDRSEWRWSTTWAGCTTPAASSCIAISAGRS